MEPVGRQEPSVGGRWLDRRPTGNRGTVGLPQPIPEDSVQRSRYLFVES